MFRERKRERKGENRAALQPVAAATLLWERQETRGMFAIACAMWQEVVVRTYGLSGFRDKEFVEPWPGSFDRRHCYRTYRVRPARRRLRDVRRAHPRAILACVIARTCREKEISRERERERFSRSGPHGGSIASR